MGHNYVLLTLRKFFIYCKPDQICKPDNSPLISVLYSAIRARYRVFAVSTRGSSLVSEINDKRVRRLRKIDGKSVATDVLNNDEELVYWYAKLVPTVSWSRLRVVDATFFRHLYRKCDTCTYFTRDVGALGNQCPHCRRSNWPSRGQYIAKTKEEHAMHTQWYRSGPSSYLVGDDLESPPLPEHKEMCKTWDFIKQRKGARELDLQLYSVSPAEVVKHLGKWEDIIV